MQLLSWVTSCTRPVCFSPWSTVVCAWTMPLPGVMQLATRVHLRVVCPHMLACSARGTFVLRARTRSSPRGRRALRTLAAGDKASVVFLGTPQVETRARRALACSHRACKRPRHGEKWGSVQVAADVLERLLQTAGQEDACFEVRGPATRVPRHSGASSRLTRARCVRPRWLRWSLSRARPKGAAGPYSPRL